MTATGAQRQPAGLQPCGTHAAYMKDRRDACPRYLDRSVHSAKARQDALRQLAERHPGEFAALLEAARWEAGL